MPAKRSQQASARRSALHPGGADRTPRGGLPDDRAAPVAPERGQASLHRARHQAIALLGVRIGAETTAQVDRVERRRAGRGRGRAQSPGRRWRPPGRPGRRARARASRIRSARRTRSRSSPTTGGRSRGRHRGRRAARRSGLHRSDGTRLEQWGPSRPRKRRVRCDASGSGASCGAGAACARPACNCSICSPPSRAGVCDALAETPARARSRRGSSAPRRHARCHCARIVAREFDQPRDVATRPASGAGRSLCEHARQLAVAGVHDKWETPVPVCQVSSPSPLATRRLVEDDRRVRVSRGAGRQGGSRVSGARRGPATAP